MRKRNDSKQHDLSLLLFLADAAVGDKNKTDKYKTGLSVWTKTKLFTELRHKKSKRVALIILALANNRKQNKSAKSDLRLAKYCLTWAKLNRETLINNKASK